MSLVLQPEEFRLLRDFIQAMCGIVVTDEKAYLIENRLQKLALNHNCKSFSEFYFLAKNNGERQLRNDIVDAMTTRETLWFRDGHPFTILHEVLLKEYASQVEEGARKKIRIWCAACSSGQEPYSIVMVLLDQIGRIPPLTVNHFEIFSTDISDNALAQAKLGSYDSFSMNRGLPEAYRNRYFTNGGRHWTLKDEVKNHVTFKQLNLQESFAKLGLFDLILCRNVAIYFSGEFKRDLYRKLASALTPKGYLFLGASESIGGYSTDFELLDYKGGIYYRVRKE